MADSRRIFASRRMQKEQSKKYNTLVDAAPELIKDLPWSADFEGAAGRSRRGASQLTLIFAVPEFKRPDFTALEILSFATGGIPAGELPQACAAPRRKPPLTESCTGINIPNYHDVRENDGFKNVSLSNILSAKAKGEVATFIAPEEREMHDKWADKAFEVSTFSLLQ